MPSASLTVRTSSAMRFSTLRLIAHDVAASLASGSSSLDCMRDLDVFWEAANSPERFIEVDFLAGTATSGPISPKLSQAIGRFREMLQDLCEAHGAPGTALRQVRARYYGTGRSATFVVTVEDTCGRLSTDTYVGMPRLGSRTGDCARAL